MSDSERPRESSDSSAEFQQALERFERALRELVASKKGELTGRATAFIDDATRRLQREFRSALSGSGEDTAARSRNDRRHRSRHRHRCGRRRHGATRPKIAGVCAHIADQYGMEPWVVRLTAITGLLFLPSIVFPAYWILWFVYRRPRSGADVNPPSSPANHSSPAPEFGPRLSPRNSLRNVQDTLAQAELKLRRMESHITSGQFELQRELRKIDA